MIPSSYPCDKVRDELCARIALFIVFFFVLAFVNFFQTNTRLTIQKYITKTYITCLQKREKNATQNKR